MRTSIFITLLALTGFLLFDPKSGAFAPDEDPVAVFAELDGTWEGEFVGYDERGVELYRLTVKQVYRTLDANTQEVVMQDRSREGKLTTGRGRNVARRLPDGSLQLSCSVEKSDGDRVEHSGRLGRGPDGEQQIIWYSDAPGRQETFREVVRKLGAESVYTIDGVGRYGESSVLMAGRYRKR